MFRVYDCCFLNLPQKWESEKGLSASDSPVVVVCQLHQLHLVFLSTVRGTTRYVSEIKQVEKKTAEPKKSKKRSPTHQLEHLDAVFVLDRRLPEVRLQAVRFPQQAELRLCVLVLDQRGRVDGVHLQPGGRVVVLGQDVLQLLLVDLEHQPSDVKPSIINI